MFSSFWKVEKPDFREKRQKCQKLHFCTFLHFLKNFLKTEIEISKLIFTHWNTLSDRREKGASGPSIIGSNLTPGDRKMASRTLKMASWDPKMDPWEGPKGLFPGPLENAEIGPALVKGKMALLRKTTKIAKTSKTRFCTFLSLLHFFALFEKWHFLVTTSFSSIAVTEYCSIHRLHT